MKNKHVNGPKNYCQLNQFSSCQKTLTEMSCYVNSVLLMSILWYYDMQYENNMYLYVAWFIRHYGLGLGGSASYVLASPHRKFLASALSFSGLINKPAILSPKHVDGDKWIQLVSGNMYGLKAALGCATVICPTKSFTASKQLPEHQTVFTV